MYILRVHVFPCSRTFSNVPERPGTTGYKMRVHVLRDVLERSRTRVRGYKIRVHMFPSVPNVVQQAVFPRVRFRGYPCAPRTRSSKEYVLVFFMAYSTHIFSCALCHESSFHHIFILTEKKNGFVPEINNCVGR